MISLIFSCGNRLYSFAAGETNYLNAIEDETIELGTPKLDIENYPSDYAERWILIVPEGRKVQIDFKNDYVEFREASIMVGDPKRIYGHFWSNPDQSSVWKCKAKLDTESREHGLGSVNE